MVFCLDTLVPLEPADSYTTGVKLFQKAFLPSEGPNISLAHILGSKSRSKRLCCVEGSSQELEDMPQGLNPLKYDLRYSEHLINE
jgi:hypothetical protein